MLPRWMDSTLIGGFAVGLNSMQHSQLVLFSYGVLLSLVLATAKIVSRKDKLVALGVCIALLLLIPATMANQLSTATMQLAYHGCKKMDMARYQMNAYNMISVLMGWLPWMIVDVLAPKKEDKPQKRQKAKARDDADDEDELTEKNPAAAKKVKQGKVVSKKKN
mmetsp:Transcript_50783/g.132100  ORF Transcript_50783/g.132100 Transcript_50783/m.132100 type:complete len:164 (-) Transcript_50783:47-538(-)